MEERLKLVAASEAAARLGVHPKTVWRLIKRGRLAGVQLVGRWLVQEDSLESLSKTYVGKKGRPKGYSPKRRRDESSTLR